jgi:hypothetical protein
MFVLQIPISVHGIVESKVFFSTTLGPKFARTIIHVGVHIHTMDNVDVMVLNKDI